MKQFIASSATALPPFKITQGEAQAFLKKNYSTALSPASLKVLMKVLSHPSIRERHLAMENLDVLLNEDPDKRMERFTHWSVRLSAEAVRKALAGAGLEAGDVSALVVNTCTGYICPGIATYLIETLGLKKTTRAYDLVGSGCGGAIPNVQLCQALLKESPDGVVVSVSVEICSCTFEMDNDLSLLISNSLFGDGASAAVLGNRPKGLEIVSSHSRFAPELREHIRYVHREGRLHNQLSPELPKLAAQVARQTVEELLKKAGLQMSDVRHWAVHPGGEKVINAVRDELGLDEELLAPSRQVLKNFGNLSSPTVWFVLEEIRKRSIQPGEWVLMLAFGAGLSAHALLLKQPS